MRKLLFILVASFVGFTLFPMGIKADGGVFPPPDYWIRESDQKAVIFYENGKETLILSTTFKGNAKDFGWVIPVPQKPEVTKGSDEIFTSLYEITRKYPKGIYPLAPMMKEGLGGGEPVTVIETKKIDYYDIAVLSATDSQALARWLSENGYQYPEESAYILNDYINNKWYFVAVKISPEAAGAKGMEGLSEGHATPLKLEFSSEAIIYPLRISAIEVGQEVIKLSDNLFLNRERVKHLQDIGYEELTDEKEGPKIFSKIVSDLISGKDYFDSVASEYPLIVSQNDYSRVTCYDAWDCRPTVESWFNRYFERVGLYFYYDYYGQNYISLNLYVIADHKKEIPGFSTDYANWISAKEVRKLAYDVNGRPLIDPDGKKYYLTSFYRTMSTKEMTQDLVVRNADNNKRVNAPNPWLNWLYGGLTGMATILFWLFSPLGLIFIAATLIKGLVKSRTAQILSRVFQVLSFVATLGFFILFLVVSFEPTFGVFEKFWSLGIASGLGLILIGQIIVGKKI